MAKELRKGSDGLYHTKSGVFKKLVGTRAEVWHGTAYKTSGGLTKANLIQNKSGRIVSRVKHTTAKREKRLEKHGYFAKKGKFGHIFLDNKRRSRSKSRKSKTKKRARTI